MSLDFSRDNITGVAWDKALQPIFNAKCVSCHNATSTIPGLSSYTITDPATGDSITINFDLSDTMLNLQSGSIDLGSWPASYISMAGPDMEAIERGNLVISGDFKVYMEPQNSRGSAAIVALNPMVQFPNQDPNVRAFPGVGHMAEQGQPELTPDEMYAFILAADMGVNFYARENNPGLTTY